MISLIDIKLFFKNIFDKGFFHLISANILIHVFAFASQLFVAWILSPEDIGRIKIIQTYLSIFSIIAGMGFNSSTLKICSEGKSHADNSVFLNSALLFSFISSTLLYSIILLINSFGLLSSDQLIKALIPIGLFPIISNTLFMVYIAYFQAVRKVKLFSGLTVYNKVISIIAIIFATFFWGVSGYYISYNISFLIMIVIAAIIIKKNIKFSFQFNFKEMFSNHWKYAKSSLLSNIISETSAFLDIILIGYLISDMKEIGYYSFALTVTVVLRIFPATVQQITIPYFSSTQSQKTDFLKIFKRYNRILYLVVFITLILLLTVALPLIHWLFNGKYDPSSHYLILLSIGWSIRNLNQLQSGAIFGLGMNHYNAITAFIALAGNIIFYPIALHYWGITGVAFGSILSGIVICLTSRYFFNRTLEKTIWKA